MRVQNRGRSQRGIKHGVHGTSGERRDGERHKSERKGALKGPVVGALGGMAFGDRGGVVYCVLLDGWQMAGRRGEVYRCPGSPGGRRGECAWRGWCGR